MLNKLRKEQYKKTELEKLYQAERERAERAERANNNEKVYRTEEFRSVMRQASNELNTRHTNVINALVIEQRKRSVKMATNNKW